jgi:hypothetical protein
MTKSSTEKIVASISIDLAGQEGRIEKLPADETGKAALRISGGQKGAKLARPLKLSEEQLIELLYNASLSGVISKDFIGKLREKIEI